MAISLKTLQPHKVSKDLRGYSVLFYGEPKSGKTTIATKFPKHLLLAAEKGYNAIPGANAQPINTWGEFKQVLIQLRDPEVQSMFETVIVDTADLAYDLCEKFVCSMNNVDTVADMPFGKGYGLVAKEFDDALRLIIQLGYGLVLISHSVDKTFTNEAGQEYQQIVPTLGNKPRNIVNRLCDIIGYSRAVQTEEGLKTKLYMRGTPRYVAGSRFKHTPDVIDFSYANLVSAIGEAIDKQMEEDGQELFTDSRGTAFVDTTKNLDFDDLMKEFNDIVGKLMAENQEYYSPRIVEITDKVLGKGKKMKDCDRSQVEAVDLVVAEMKTLIK